MKIYTKTGDEGTTSLLAGGRVPKHHLRVEAYGTMDELNSLIGVARAFNEDEGVEAELRALQPRLHRLCSDIAATPGEGNRASKAPRITQEDVEALEQAIDRMTAELPALTNFIHPGGGQAGSLLHLARTVCRRGERRITELRATGDEVGHTAMEFVNRLSDYLFTLARWANHSGGVEEEMWDGA